MLTIIIKNTNQPQTKLTKRVVLQDFNKVIYVPVLDGGLLDIQAIQEKK